MDNLSSLTSQRWRVWRQDDNGNRFLISRNLSEEDAIKPAQHLESRGHKQVYWADCEPDKTTDGSTG